MAETTRVEIPDTFLGAAIPASLRVSLDLHTRYLDSDDARSLVAAALASWVINSSERHSQP